MSIHVFLFHISMNFVITAIAHTIFDNSEVALSWSLVVWGLYCWFLVRRSK